MEGINFYTQEHCTIYGHQVWHYLIDTPIGQIHVVDYEGEGMQINRTIIDGNNAKAEKLFRRICNKMLKGGFI